MIHFQKITILFFVLLCSVCSVVFAESNLIQEEYYSDDGYLYLSQENWNAHLEMSDGEDTSILILESSDGKRRLKMPIDNQGGEQPNISRIEEVNICGKDYVVVTTSFFFFVDFPSYVYERHIVALATNKLVDSVFDEQSQKAGGIVPARISTPIYDHLSCTLSR